MSPRGVVVVAVRGDVADTGAGWWPEAAREPGRLVERDPGRASAFRSPGSRELGRELGRLLGRELGRELGRLFGREPPPPRDRERFRLRSVASSPAALGSRLRRRRLSSAASSLAAASRRLRPALPLRFSPSPFFSLRGFEEDPPAPTAFLSFDALPLLLALATLALLVLALVAALAEEAAFALPPASSTSSKLSSA